MPSVDEGLEFLLEALGLFRVLFHDVGFLGRVGGEVEELELLDFFVTQFFGDDGVACGFFGMSGEFPVSRTIAVVSFAAVVLLDEGGAALCFWFAKEGVDDVFAVTTGGLWDGGAGEAREAGGEVDGADDLL